MRSRHRVPAVFSLSMLDVLCCGLGAVILLMLLNFWDARRQAGALAQARERVEKTAGQLKETESALSSSRTELQELQAKLSRTHDDLRRAEQDLKLTREEKEQLLTKLSAEEKKVLQALADLRQTKTQLESNVKQRAMTQADLASALKDIAELRRLLQQTDKQRAEAAAIAAKVPNLQEALAAAKKLAEQTDADLQQLRKIAEDTGLQLTDARKKSQTAEESLKSAGRRATTLEKELTDLRKRAEEAGFKLTQAQKQSQTVAVEVTTLRRLLDEQRASAGRLERRLGESEARFAGVDLSGRRVVFLVDISGSMGSVDADRLDPGKWPEVCRNVVHLLRSLPGVEKYQIIIFADDAKFLLGQSGQWLDYARDKSPNEVELALARITPQGNTNLYAAFDSAFQFRQQGLESIYLFSDGIPNIGPGLPTDAPRDEAAQGALLGKHVRDTIRGRWNSGDPRVRIHAVGFFYESPNLGAFLWSLTRENGGSFVGMSKP